MWKPSYNWAIEEQGIKSSRSAGVCVCATVTTKGDRESDLVAQSSSHQKAKPLHGECQNTCTDTNW